MITVYPTLDHSDQEDGHVFKPRGRLKKDETWNPKGSYLIFFWYFCKHKFNLWAA